MPRRDRNQVYCKAMAFLQENLYHKITIKEVADHCGVCISGLQRDFHNFAGSGVSASLSLLRLEESKRLLAKGMTVGDVANQLHYSSMPHFSMAFKKQYGQSPLQYKKQHKK